MASHITPQKAKSAAFVLLTLLLIGLIYGWLRLSLDVQALRREVDAVHAEMSSVKPWAKTGSALKDALAIYAPTVQSVAAELSNDAAPRVKAPTSIERRYGPEKSLFTLVIYSDPECPYCKQYNAVPKAIVDSSGGNVSFVFKHVPLHKEASRIESLATECAGEQGGNTGFFKMLDAVFSNTRGGGGGVTQALPAMAAQIGLDGSRLRECIDSDRYMPKLATDLQEASSIGIDKTPTTVVRNNVSGKSLVIPGVSSAEVLMQAMASLVDQKN